MWPDDALQPVWPVAEIIAAIPVDVVREAADRVTWEPPQAGEPFRRPRLTAPHQAGRERHVASFPAAMPPHVPVALGGIWLCGESGADQKARQNGQEPVKPRRFKTSFGAAREDRARRRGHRQSRG